MSDEQFPLVNEHGAVVGSTLRSDCHGNPELLHPVVHCLVENSPGELLLQLRHRNKKIQPRKWDTSVGGHVCFGETPEEALVREVAEEIGLPPAEFAPAFLYQYVMRNESESELVYTYRCTYDGPVTPQPEEVEELRWWSTAEIRSALGTGFFTPNFEDEWRRFQAWKGEQSSRASK